MPAKGEATLCGLLLVTNDATGLAEKVFPLRLGGCLSQTPLEDIDNYLGLNVWYFRVSNAMDSSFVNHFALWLKTVELETPEYVGCVIGFS